MDKVFCVLMIFSILIQFSCAYLSLRLIKITKTRIAWVLISLAFVLMGLRRVLALAFPGTLLAEIIALTISVLLLIGITKIGPLFLSVRRSEEKLQIAQGALLQAHCQLEEKVKERTSELAEKISELKQTQEALLVKDKLALVGQMAAGMAHEVKNPLTSVRGFSQIIAAKAKQDKELSRYASIIIEEVDKATSVISDFLTLARPKPSEAQVCSIDKIIQDTVSTLGPQALVYKVNIQYRGTDNTLQCLVDMNQIKQVLFNLCKNGIEAMQEGGTLKIAVGSSNQEIFIDIEDTGSGVPKERLKDIFVPFYTTKDNGTGLGLSICYSFIEANKGRIDVTSTTGVGTKFRVHLPGYSY